MPSACADIEVVNSVYMNLKSSYGNMLICLIANANPLQILKGLNMVSVARLLFVYNSKM